MRYQGFVLVMAAVAGVYVTNRQEHQRTRQLLDEVTALLAVRQEAAQPKPEVRMAPAGTVPVELNHLTLPPYVIEAPDQLCIEVATCDPKTNALNRLPVQPISGGFQVRTDGTVGLGVWGSVAVANLTAEQTVAAVKTHLMGTTTWKEVAAQTGEPVVFVHVSAKNSKRYYLVFGGDDQSEKVVAFAQTGHETVLDAIANCGIYDGIVKREVYLKRKTSTGDQILPVDWTAIFQHGVTATNYPVLAGDRIYVSSRQ